MALEVAKPFLKKCLQKLITSVNIAFIGYELNDLTHKNNEIAVRNVTTIIKNDNQDISLHTWIALIFVIIITILSLIKLFITVRTKSAADRIPVA